MQHDKHIFLSAMLYQDALSPNADSSLLVYNLVNNFSSRWDLTPKFLLQNQIRLSIRRHILVVKYSPRNAKSRLCLISRNKFRRCNATAELQVKIINWILIEFGLKHLKISSQKSPAKLVYFHCVAALNDNYYLKISQITGNFSLWKRPTTQLQMFLLWQKRK